MRGECGQNLPAADPGFLTASTCPLLLWCFPSQRPYPSSFPEKKGVSKTDPTAYTHTYTHLQTLA